MGLQSRDWVFTMVVGSTMGMEFTTGMRLTMGMVVTDFMGSQGSIDTFVPEGGEGGKKLTKD